MALPRPCIVTDLVMKTPWGYRRNRFYWEATVQPTGITQLEAICNRVHAVISPQVAVLCTTQIEIERMEGRYFGTGTTGFEGNSTTASVQGEFAAVTPGSATDESESSIADTMPDESVLIIQKRTGNTSRSKNGRWFFSGLSEQMQNAGIIDPEMTANAKALADLLSTDITVSVGFSTVLHARHFDQKNSNLLPITKCYALRVIGTRKDRRRPLKLERL